MEKLFLQVLNMSAIGGVVILLILFSVWRDGWMATQCEIINWGGKDGPDIFHSIKDKEAFIYYLNTYSDKAKNVPFLIETKNGFVTKITEQYVP